jgi:thioredoxin-dependent peroxiredoxin
MAEPQRLAPGDQAPAFELPDQNEQPVSLASLSGERVMLFFYPKANTGGCTTQACGLRDIAGNIGGTRILGMSPDAPAAQKKWDDKHTLGFPLLSDGDHSVAEAYGVWALKKVYGKESVGIVRSAFLIGADGLVEHAWYKVSPKVTPEYLLAALEA